MGVREGVSVSVGVNVAVGVLVGRGVFVTVGVKEAVGVFVGKAGGSKSRLTCCTSGEIKPLAVVRSSRYCR